TAPREENNPQSYRCYWRLGRTLKYKYLFTARARRIGVGGHRRPAGTPRYLSWLDPRLCALGPFVRDRRSAPDRSSWPPGSKFLESAVRPPAFPAAAGGARIEFADRAASAGRSAPESCWPVP